MAVEHADVLTSAVDALESRFALRGCVRQGIEVRVNGEDDTVKFPLSNEQVESFKMLDPIVQNATASPFGHGKQTKLDESVRRG